ncbi:MAG: alpha-amylase [bacterium]|nr:alpha-amylase [bacterium]
MMLARERPLEVAKIPLPRHEEYHPSPTDWRDEVLYFLLPDRFSDERNDRPLLDRNRIDEARPAGLNWENWAKSGSDRWQGGTIRGATSRLFYLKKLGITTIWLGPVFKQRGHLDTYHGYGIQDFLDVDPRFGTRADLVELVAEAHWRGIRVILDIIFNHSGANWLYPPGTPARDDNNSGELIARYTMDSYSRIRWRDRRGRATEKITQAEDGVWPKEFQSPNRYTRAGSGNLGGDTPENLDDPASEYRRTDFEDMRDFQLREPETLSWLARCYKYWIALTDCDGFRIDTLKHVSKEEGRNFCGAIKEYAANLGKDDFFLVGEVAGADANADAYLDALGRNLNATLRIGESRLTLNHVAKGLQAPSDLFSFFENHSDILGTKSTLGKRFVTCLDDHDHVCGGKIRFSHGAASDHQIVAGVALQLFTLGVPCLYYGTEQALTGGPAGELGLPSWREHDRYLREAMFGPEHPRATGVAGNEPGNLDGELPGFGPSGTVGHHCFDVEHPAFRRIAELNRIRVLFPVLRKGRQYLRPLAVFGDHLQRQGPGELIAWSRILDDEESLCILNSHGREQRGGRILVDRSLTPAGSKMTVIVNTMQAGCAGDYTGPYAVGTRLPVRSVEQDGWTADVVEIGNLEPSEMLILSNHVSVDKLVLLLGGN